MNLSSIRFSRGHSTAMVAFLSALTCLSAKADFISGQSADRALGGPPPEVAMGYAGGLAVDPVTKKVFVSSTSRHCVLRYSSVASLQTGGSAEAVLGQPDFTPAGSGLAANRMNTPRGLAADSAGRLWVVDSGNHRVLRFDAASSAASGASASGVLGQGDFTSNTYNASHLRLPFGIAADHSGRLWVSDTFNHRVLRFDSAASLLPGATPSAVLGQTDFTAVSPGIGAVGFNRPAGLALRESQGPGGTWTTTHLWVADELQNRVLRFDSPGTIANGAAANAVLGQTDFVTYSSAVTASKMKGPKALAMDNDRLWVGDTGNNRALRFENAANLSNGAAASGVLGQANFNTGSAGVDPWSISQPDGLAVDNGRLWVNDQLGQRVLRHDQAASKGATDIPNSVLGQRTLDILQVSASNFGSSIGGLAVDAASGKLFVCDGMRNRVLRFASAQSLASGAAAEAVLGQPNLTTSTANLGAASMSQPRSISVDSGGRLWVADSGNNRVLRFNSAATIASGSSASAVFGQPNFTSGGAGTTLAKMNGPAGISLESGLIGVFPPTFGIVRLWVADTGNNRVLRFENPLSAANGASASGLLGQTAAGNTGTSLPLNFYKPIGLAVELGGRLWVSDSRKNRVLRFDNAQAKADGTQADGVLLQPDFITTTEGLSATKCNLCSGVAMDAGGRLYVADTTNGRVIWFDQAASKPNGAAADGVIGQKDFVTSVNPTFDQSWSTMAGVRTCLIDPFDRLWAGDDSHARVLRFSPDPMARIFETGFTNSGKFYISFTAEAGYIIEVRSSPDLVDWSTVEKAYETTGSNQVFSANSVPNSPRRFYRLQLQ